ncbi:RNA polymerase sigma factor [Paenibacillus chartarius]|uniref:RNA polymerase sigma factor n=1 Tax=Paenibacillus chartarius TaxID=747481 RepID=A0ABV6DHE4_9BACL
MTFHYLQFAAEGLDKERALTDLMQEYGKDVWKYAYFLTLRADAADDLMQDTFLKAYRQLGSFRGDASVKTWLFAITRRAFLDYRKSYWIRNVIATGFKQPEKPVSSAEQEAISAFERQEVWTSVFALPAKLREVLLLYAHYDMDIEEIAQLLHIPPGTVKSRMHRARSKINDRMKEDQP